MAAVTDTTHVRTVEGELSYLDPASKILRRFTAPGISVNTGSYRSYVMPIHNGRPIADRFTLDRNGFALISHSTAVTDFTDRDEVDRVYVPEVAELVRSSTGADCVATMRWMLRRSAAPDQYASQPQAASVHDDYSVIGAGETAAATYAARFPDGPGFRRALIT